MSTIKTTNITHGSNSGTANLTLASDGKVTIPEKKLYCPGAVVQVLQTQKLDTGSSAAATFTNLTGMTVDITPTAASSKILISSVLTGNGDVANYAHYFRYYRSISGGAATAIGVGTAESNRIAAGFVQHTYPSGSLKYDTISFQWLDSPSTTSAITYTIQHRRTDSSSGTYYYGRCSGDGDSSSVARLPSILTVMEIAG